MKNKDRWISLKMKESDNKSVVIYRDKYKRIENFFSSAFLLGFIP